MNTTYDIVFVGSGPINLVKAYLLLKKNPQLAIQFIDDQPKIGGAWFSDRSNNGHEIESGCHIWSYCPEVYCFIEKELEIPLVLMSPKPVFVYNSWLSIPYATKGIIDSYKYLVASIVKFKFFQFKQIKTQPQLNTAIFNRHNRYPKKGSPELINTLLKKIKSFPSVDFQLNTAVSGIKILPDALILATPTNEISCQKIILTSVSKIDVIETVETQLKVTRDIKKYIHLLVQLPQKPIKRVGYIRLMKDAVIHRITDVSYQTENQEQLLLLGILENAFDSMTTDELYKYVKNYIVQARIINEDQPIKFMKNYIFPTHYIEENKRKEINKLDDRLVLQHSTDLMYGMYHLLREENII